MSSSCAFRFSALSVSSQMRSFWIYQKFLLLCGGGWAIGHDQSAQLAFSPSQWQLFFLTKQCYSKKMHLLLDTLHKENGTCLEFLKLVLDIAVSNYLQNNAFIFT